VTTEITRTAPDTVVDLVPFIRVSDVAHSIRFYEALGFRVVKRYEPTGRLEFAGLESTAAAKVMLARVDRVAEPDSDRPTPGFLYLYTSDLDAFRNHLLDHGIEPDEITDGPGPGRNREMCVRDPDGYGHMVAELWPGSIGGDPSRPERVARLLAALRPLQLRRAAGGEGR
jgi:catechol 2,3-dioxygenase-like lactoylglutathione lyase family enzyme